MTNRFVRSIVSDASGFGWLMFDLKKRDLVEPLCDYADEMIWKAQLSRLSVDQEMGYLFSFWVYLQSDGDAGVELVTDALLRRFRDDALERVVRSPSHRGSTEAAKATVNAKLVRIYDWLKWMQDASGAARGLIGPRSCRVTSALEKSAVSSSSQRARRPEGRVLYPLLFRTTAGKSKHRLAKFVPTEDTLDAVTAYFHSASGSAHVAHRNATLASLACYTGFRRASLQSLTVSQFLGAEVVLAGRDTVLIKPSRQKFGYGDSFELPIWLHEQVKSFVLNYRQLVLDRTGASTSVHKDHVFISDRDARPLTDRALSSLMSRALRANGAAKGAAMHCWRTKFAVEETAAEYEHRRALGLDTSVATMDLVIARKLGHRNSESARAYTSSFEAAEVSRKRAARKSAEDTSALRMRALEDEVVMLKSLLVSNDRS